MAEADWTALTDDPGVGAIDRGVTNGIARPPGGGNFVFGFNSLVNSELAVALYTNQTNFAPTAALKGGSVRGVMKRGLSGGPINFAPFLFAGLQGTSSGDSAYMLGLADGDPSHIVLRKGTLFGGLPDSSPDISAGILARSVRVFPQDTYVQLRLDWIVNQNGDVLLQVFRNDLVLHPDVTAPVWVPEPGLEDFVDDTLHVNSGTAPFTSGYMGFGMKSKDVNRRAFFDQLQIFRQT